MNHYIHINKPRKYFRIVVLFACIAVFTALAAEYKTVFKNLVDADADGTGASAEFRTDMLTVPDGGTFATVLQDAGFGVTSVNVLYAAALPVYDLASVRAGNAVSLKYDDAQGGKLVSLTYAINTEEELRLTRNNALEIAAAPDAPLADVWDAERADIPYETRIRTVSGTVTSSLYEAALATGIDERAIVDFADVFQWTIDFALDPRSGDSFAFIYEERFLDGAYVMPGKIIAGRYMNDGEPFELYYFHADDEDVRGYYDAEGNSARKMFLKVPVSFKYISSGFTTGGRYIQEFNISTGHRAVDYAASYGTPIRSVGDGTVALAGWNSSGYGYYTVIRHNATYSTAYAHQSRIAVKQGQHVSQGQTIGYVGSTGLSTGPHLHYEIIKNGVKINPLLLEMPPEKPLPQGYRNEFDLSDNGVRNPLLSFRSVIPYFYGQSFTG